MKLLNTNVPWYISYPVLLIALAIAVFFINQSTI